MREKIQGKGKSGEEKCKDLEEFDRNLLYNKDSLQNMIEEGILEMLLKIIIATFDGINDIKDRWK